jgi:hypothetical protein
MREKEGRGEEKKYEGEGINNTINGEKQAKSYRFLVFEHSEISH